MKYATVYCDESGNTGPNFIDPQQPFYVLAGWWVLKNNEAKVSGIISQAISKHSDGVHEVKGGALIKTNKGKKTILSLISALRNNGCMPFFIIAEKRYCIAAKVIETFFDPEYNDKISYDFWNDVESKQNAADRIYDLSDHVLNEFAKAYRALDLESLRKSAYSIFEALTQIPSPIIADMVSGTIPVLPNIVRDEVASGEDIPGSGYRTLNMPIFVSFISMIELRCRTTEVSRVTVSHDSIPEFQDTYNWAFQLYSTGSRTDIPLSNGTKIPLGFEHIKELKMLHSHSSPYIQAADILASSLCSLFNMISSETDISPDLVEIGKKLAPLMLVEPQFGTIMASSRLIKQFGEVIHR